MLFIRPPSGFKESTLNTHVSGLTMYALSIVVFFLWVKVMEYIALSLLLMLHLPGYNMKEMQATCEWQG